MAGKSLDELNFKPQPTSTKEPHLSTDPRGTEWYRFCQDIQDLLATGKYNWAEQTLQDIAVTVERTQRITDGQRRAVNNIEQAANRPKRGFSRRYEGYR